MQNLYYIHSFIHMSHAFMSFIHAIRSVSFIHSCHAFLPSFIRSFIHPFITFVINSCYEFIHSFRSFRPSIIPLDHFMTFIHFVAFHSFHSMHSFLHAFHSFLHDIHSFISFMHFMHSFISCIHSFLPSSIQSFIWKLNWERQIAQSLRASIYLEALRGTPNRLILHLLVPPLSN